MTVAGADAWADAPLLPLGTSSLPTNTSIATADGPQDYGERSIWWKIELPETTDLSVDLLQSTGGDFFDNSVFAAVVLYEGTDLSDLSSVGGSFFANDFESYGNRGEREFEALPAGTYWVAVEPDFGSDDFDAVLRVAAYTFEWSDWFQPDDYELLSDDVSSDVDAVGDSWFGAHATVTGDYSRDYFVAETDAALAASPWVKGGVFASWESAGLFASNSENFPEIEYSGTAWGQLWCVKPDWPMYQIALADDAAILGGYHYDWEYESIFSQLTGWVVLVVEIATVSKAGNGAEQPIADASLSVEMQALPNALDYFATWPTWTWETSGTAIHTFVHPGTDSQDPVSGAYEPGMPDVEVDVTGFLDSEDETIGGDVVSRKAVMLRRAPSGYVKPADDHSFGTQSLGGGYKHRFTLHPPLARVQDKVLQVTPTIRRRPPLRQFPRSDGLGMSSARRVDANRSQQATLRRAGGTYY